MTAITFIIAVLITIESGGDVNAVGDNGKSVGCLQIQKVMVDEVNRISGSSYSYDDRYNYSKSIEMCKVFLLHQIDRYEKRHGYKPTAEELACSWQSGSIFKQSSKDYKVKVRNEIIKRLQQGI